MPRYPLVCHGLDCEREAEFKIAARWSDGVTGELKTYFLACPACVAGLFERARVKKAGCRLAPGESLADPEVYELARGQRDRALVRRQDMERR